MNIEKLVQYLDNKLPLKEESLSELNQLVEEYPYFQTAHMLLLKTLLNLKKDSYSKQLQKSVCYISDKYKLFQFVNLDLPTIRVEKPESNEPNKEIPKKPEKRQINAIADKLPTTPDKEPNKEPDKKTSEEPVKTVRPKPELLSKLSDEEIERLNFDNSNQRHGTIVGDFFNNVKKKSVSINKDEEPKNDTKSSFSKFSSPKKDISTPSKTEKDLPLKSNVRSESLEVKKPIGKPDIEKRKPKIKIVETTQKTESPYVKKEPVKENAKVDFAPTVKKEESVGSESKKMNDIFSKIKKIKKEMSVNEAQGKAQVIDLNSENDKKEERQVKPKETKKPKLVIKESFVGGDGSEEEKIKESDLTAKDLFNRHKQRIAETSKLRNDIKEPVYDSKPKVETKEKLKAVVKQSDKLEISNNSQSSTKEKIEDVSGEPTAAEKLLQRIEARKKQRESAKIEEERQKELLKQKEIDAIDEIIKTTPKKDPVFNNDNKTVDGKDKKENSAQEEQKIAKEENEKEKEIKLKKEFVVKTDDITEEKPINTEIAKAKEHDADKPTSEDSKKYVVFDNTSIEEEEEKTSLIREIKEEIKKEKEANLNRLRSENTKNSNVISDINTEIKDNKNEIKKETVEDIKEPVLDKSSENIQKNANDLIDSFIAKSESLERIGTKESSLKGDVSALSTSESEDYMTETYADLLVQQKKYSNAKEVYEKLILKYPEKKTYFAIQIKKVEGFIK